jgi:hypothetical protein
MQCFHSSYEYFYHVFLTYFDWWALQTPTTCCHIPILLPSPSAPRHIAVYLELSHRCPQYHSFSLNIHFRTWHSSRVLATHAVNCSNRRKVFSFSRGQVRRIGETLRELSHHGRLCRLRWKLLVADGTART